MAKTEFIRARVEPELKYQGRRNIFEARVVPYRCDYAVLCAGHPSRGLTFRSEDSEYRDY